jgi:hypothetical protein
MVKLWKKFASFARWAQVLIVIALIALAIGLVTRFVGGVHQMIFGNTEATKAQAETYAWQGAVESIQKTGQVARDTTVKTYKRHTEVDRIVGSGNNEIARVNKGQQMDPAIDAAVANGLCQLNASLCRVHDGADRRATGS